MEKPWVEAINSHGFDEWTVEGLINEMVRTVFVGDVPPGLAFLGGQGTFIDLGFKELGLPPEELQKILLAFGGTGVRVPEMPFRLRHARVFHSLIEPLDGTEQATLPKHWRQGVLVGNSDHKFSWVGKMVQIDRFEIDLANYKDVGDGFRLA